MKFMLVDILTLKYLFVFILYCVFVLNGTPQSSDRTSYFPEIDIIDSNNPAPGYLFISAPLINEIPGVSYIAIIDNFGTPVFFRLMNSSSWEMSLQPDDRIAYFSGNPTKFFL